MVSRYKFYSFKIVFSPLPFVWINMTKLDLVLELSIQPPLMVWVTWPIDHLWMCLAPPPFDFDWCNRYYLGDLGGGPRKRIGRCRHICHLLLSVPASTLLIHPYMLTNTFEQEVQTTLLHWYLHRWAFHLYSGLTIPVPAAHFTPTRPSVGRYATWGARPARGNLIMILEALDMIDTIG